MKISTTWIQKLLCRTILDEEIVQAIERSGLEVEQYTSPKPIDQKIIVVLVKKVVQHPGADRLRLVEVDTGKEIVSIVCGAPNVVVGMKTALAQVGATLPSGDTITIAKLRGEVSHGMLCSERELGLGPDHDGITELSPALSPGTTLCDIYPADGIVDIKTHPNRWDTLSAVGLAREVAAMTDNQLSEPPRREVPDDGKGPQVSAEAKTDRYMFAKLKVNQSTPSPDWLVQRLAACGVRAISPVVDITNYVMLEYGQPLHAFDASKVKLPVTVRHASNGERLVTLDGVERKLSHLDLVIADESGPIALAGLMGGASTEVTAETTEILLEGATFEAPTVRKMAKRHGLRTEASARFERGLPVQLVPVAMGRAVQLFEELASGQLGGVSDQLNAWPWVQRIGLRYSQLVKLLGFEVSFEEAVAALGRLGIEATRFDIAAEARKHLGKPYKWGAKFRTDGTEAFDCSYFGDYLYSLIGLGVGHTAKQLYDNGAEVKLNDLLPGDLVFRGGPWVKLDAKERGGVSHVAVYVGDGRIVDVADYRRVDGEWQKRPEGEQKVIEENLSSIAQDPEYLGARRYADNLADFISVPAVPWWRGDLKVGADLVEEIVRVIGYDRVPSTIPAWKPVRMQFDTMRAPRQRLQNALFGAGLFEVMTYSFVAAEQLEQAGLAVSHHLKLRNPLSSEQAYLRTTMLPSHLRVLERNRAYAKSLSFYELSRVFIPRGEGQQPHEPWLLALTVWRPQNSFAALKGIIETAAGELGLELGFEPGEDPRLAAGRTATIYLGKDIIGVIGQLPPQVVRSHKLSGEAAYLELDVTRLLEEAGPRAYQGLARFPGITRDIAIVVPAAVTWAEVAKALARTEQAQVSYLSEYYGDDLPPGHKSLALRLVMSHPERTLTEEEAAKVEERVMSRLKQKFSADRRDG